jgi:outer membrane protein OmpA-like peptidoglycan-associated protein
LLLSLLLVRRRRLFLPLAILALVNLFSATTYAQVDGDPGEFNVERLHIPMDEGGILNVEGANTVEQGAWGAYLWLNYSDDPLVIEEKQPGEGWERVGSLVDRRLGAGFGVHGSFVDRLQLGLEVPLVLHQERDNGYENGLPALHANEISDLRLRTKFQMLRQTDDDPVNLSLGFDWSFPTSTSDAYLGEKDMGFNPYLIIGRLFGNCKLLINVGLTSRNPTSVGDLFVDSEAFASVAGSYRWNKNELGLSVTNHSRLDGFLSDHSYYTEAMAGYSYHHGNGLTAFTGVGRGLTDGFGSPDWRAFAGLRFTFQRKEKCCELPIQPYIPSVKKENTPEIPPYEPPVEPKRAVILVPTIHFELDSSELTEHYELRLTRFAKQLAQVISEERFDKPILTLGHTDAIASNKYNDALGMRRAKAVMSRLISLGIPASLITLKTHGESAPIEDNITEFGRAYNRRVEIIISDELNLTKWRVEYESSTPVETYDSLGDLHNYQ